MKKLAKRKLIKALVFVLAVCIIVLTGKYFTGQNSAKYSDKDFIAVLDVGQGDSILISSNSQAVLIDTGEEINSRNLLYQLRSYGINDLEALVISHSHDDHSGGAEYLLSNIEVDNIIVPYFRSDENVTKLNKAMSNSGAEIYIATQGMVINIGDFEITVLYADNSEEDINNRSIILMAEIDGKKMLLTGDAEKALEEAIVDDNINVDCDILKVGHHGSNTSSSEEFIKIASPEYAVISVGETNSYGHPNSEIIKRLESSGAKVLRTDYLGDVVFTFQNGEIIREQ